jgi:hypothetical protein
MLCTLYHDVKHTTSMLLFEILQYFKFFFKLTSQGRKIHTKLLGEFENLDKL